MISREYHPGPGQDPNEHEYDEHEYDEYGVLIGIETRKTEPISEDDDN